MEERPGISLNSYFCLLLAKMLCYLITFYVFSSRKWEQKRVEQVLPGSGGWGAELSQIIYTHVSRCTNDKIK
jgi:hypothetical protein